VVDRSARNIAADVIREFMEGSISNREYERRYPRSNDDLALREIYVQIWFLYSDLKEHNLSGKHALKDEPRTFLDRCILFLRSDLEFQWPRQKFRPWYGIFRIIGLGRFIDRRERGELDMGNVNVWPFLKKTEYEEVANRRPK
jgi:hypothetical protein